MIDFSPRRRLSHLLFGAGVLALAGGRPLHAAPMPNPIELARAQRVGQMPDEAPSHRINQLLAAKAFNTEELFALSSALPVIAQHFIPGKLNLATNYLFSLDGAELHKMRVGGTLIQSTRSLSSKEKKALTKISKFFDEDHEKLRGVKIGPKDGRVYVVELTYQIKKKKQQTYRIEMVPPSTPQREERARVALTKFFGARPSRVWTGVGSAIKVADASFESLYALADGWRLMDGTMLGAQSPIQAIIIDERISVDGKNSVRLYATERTRLFQNVVQEVPVTAGNHTRLRIQHRTEHIRVEFKQKRSDLKVQLTYLQNGDPIAAPHVVNGRLGSHVWEMLEIESQVPFNATEARIELISSLSGTTWFDGLIFEVVEPKGVQ